MKRTVYLTLICLIITALMVVLLYNHTLQPPRSIFSIEAGICVHTLTEQDATLVSESGAGWIRIDISNNETDLTVSLANAKNHTLSVLGILGSWMFNQSCNFSLTEWENAVFSNVSKYASYVDAWEIWNEPTSTTPYWELQVDYLSMVQIASPIIRQNDPDAEIILLGGLQLYTGGDSTQLLVDKAFAGNLSVFDLMQYGDAISVHAYPWGGQITHKVWNSYQTSLAEYRQIFGNSTLDIWVTETGQNLTHCGNDEAAQAQYTEDAFDFFNGKVSHLFCYALKDESVYQGDFGLVDVNMQPRKAYFAVQDCLK